jgi:hypothetical protein
MDCRYVSFDSSREHELWGDETTFIKRIGGGLESLARIESASQEPEMNSQPPVFYRKGGK